MDNQLLTLSKIFTERLFRIPDYQRGYAWGEKQLRDFWNDIRQLEGEQRHYTGVLTLEEVQPQVYQSWHDDLWIISAKSYQPYYVVDGQQRLTTSIILIQSILENLDDTKTLNFSTRSDIQRRFIRESKDGGISHSYTFGYETDNPSYEFLKTKIFNERSSKKMGEETTYTQNLSQAKAFFQEQTSSLSHDMLETLFRRTTQQLLFNIFTITEDVDVCVAFETMNNRGKPLSYLELLKNRLIYLSLRVDADPNDRRRLRDAINDCWKTLYHNLGKNKDKPLDDDFFLFTHYLLYFGKERFLNEASKEEPPRLYGHIIRRSRLFADDLLENRFVARNVLATAPPEDRLGISDIYEYVSSLQDAVVLWYKIWNPLESDFHPDEAAWLDRLIRLDDTLSTLPLTLAVFQSADDQKRRVDYLKAAERSLFLDFLATRHGPYFLYDRNNINLVEQAIRVKEGDISIEAATKALTRNSDDRIGSKDYIRAVVARFAANGFYQWGAIRYFLYEYNADLQGRSKTSRRKIFWSEFTESRDDYITVEHIYPRNARSSYWTTRFGGLSKKNREALRNSLGNLLPLSRAKNASLSNRPFPEKVGGPDNQSVGYQYGSYCENEVAGESEWTPMHILRRGRRMLAFLERRWSIPLGSDRQQTRMLGLSFLAKATPPE